MRPILSRALRSSLLAAALLPALPPASLSAQDAPRARPARRPDRAPGRPEGRGAPNATPFVVPDTVEVIRDLAYRDGNEMWKLDLVRAKQPAARPQPALIFIHGGGWSGGDKRFGYAGLQGAVDFAQKGYVCVAVNYRLARKAPFPAAVEDVRTAVRWLRARAAEYNVDPDRIGAYGNSAGAHLALMLALPEGHEPALDGDGPYLEHSAKIQAVCTSATPANFITGRQPRPGETTRRDVENGFLAGPAETNEARAIAASPVTYVTPDDPPVLLIHGDRDGIITLDQPEELLAKLQAAKAAEARLVVIDDAGHGAFQLHRETMIPAMESFFARTLGGHAPANPPR